MPVYSYSPSKSVFISEMKYTASQFTSIHCLEPVSMHQSITTPPPPRAPLSLMEFNNKTTATGTKTSLRKCIRAVSNFIALIPSRLIRQMLAISFLELNSRGLYQTSGNEKKGIIVSYSPPPQNVKLVVQRGQRNIQKKLDLNLLMSFRSRI